MKRATLAAALGALPLALLPVPAALAQHTAQPQQGFIHADAARFWSAPEGTASETFDRALDALTDSTDFAGLILDGPKTVNLAKQSTLPLIALRLLRSRHAAPFTLGEHSVLVAIDRKTGRSFAAVAAPTRRPGVRLPPDAGGLVGPESGVDIEQLPVDGRRALALPWQPARYTLWLVSRHFTSNPVRVALSGAAPRAGKGAPPASSKLPTASAADGKHAVKVPAQPGVVVQVGANILEGAVRLPSNQLVGESAAAVTLLVVGHRVPGPYWHTIRVAVTGGPDGDRVGHFSVPLTALGIPASTVASEPRLYARAFAGEYVSPVGERTDALRPTGEPPNTGANAPSPSEPGAPAAPAPSKQPAARDAPGKVPPKQRGCAISGANTTTGHALCLALTALAALVARPRRRQQRARSVSGRRYG